MKKTLLFAKRNLTEMIRDPLLYIFCAGFPIAMACMFQIILNYSKEKLPVFELKSLIPGIMMFGFTLLMLMSSLLVSKDRTSAFLKRLFTSPLKSYEFIIGYFIPFFVVGICQSIICILVGYILSAIGGTSFINFGQAVLLFITMLPIMIINIMLGMLFGTLLNDKSAPAITSIFISASGIIGGAWMPLDTMGNFEKICGFFPFYPSVYLGRIVTGATHTPIDEISAINPILYSFDSTAGMFIGIIMGYLVLSCGLAIIVFSKKMSSDRN